MFSGVQHRTYSRSASSLIPPLPSPLGAELEPDVVLLLAGEQLLGEVVGLGHERPVIGVERPFARHVRPHVMRRQDVDAAQPLHALGMIERHAIAGPRPRSWPATRKR